MMMEEMSVGDHLNCYSMLLSDSEKRTKSQ